MAILERLRGIHRGLPGTFWTLWAGLLVNRVATFVSAFLAPFLVRERGLDPAQAGRIVALYGVGVTVAGPLGGILADRLGRRATMLVALVVGGIAAAAIPMVGPVQGIGLLAFVTAATGDMYRPSFGAAVADLVPPADRPRAYALVYWAVNLALAAGMLVGAALATRSIALLFYADATTSVACAVLIALSVPETRPRGGEAIHPLKGAGQVVRDAPFMTFAALYLGGLLVFGQWQLGLPLDMVRHGFGPSAYATLMALNCAGVVVLQPIISPRLRAVDGGHLLAVMTLLFGLGYGLNALGGSLLVYAIGCALWTVGEVIGFPVAAAMTADLAPAHLRGTYQGVYAMMAGLAFVFAPLVGGEVYGRFGPTALWIGCLAVGVTVAAGHLAAAPGRRLRVAAARAGEGVAGTP
jgi:MFS family permease